MDSQQPEQEKTITATAQPEVDELEPTKEPDQPTPTVAHKLIPGEPGARNSFLDDVNSALSAGDGGVTFGDIFRSGRYERPFQAQDMTYLPELDITHAEIAFDQDFFYFTIFLEDRPPEDAQGDTYALELDFDRDGRGDELLIAQGPLTESWQTERVWMWSDENDDVGGQTPVVSDAAGQPGDGYENLVFDHGYGGDPDSAWARLDSEGDAAVQFAVKRDVLDAQSGFLWAAWASGGEITPDRFDVNDRLTEVEAGSPILDDQNYPLVDLDLVDNTCRMYFGFTPTGNEPGVCALPATPTPQPTATATPTEAPQVGEILGLVWIDLDLDATKDGFEPPINGHTVEFWAGACPGSGQHWSVTTAYIEYGTNYLLQLSPGTYCVSTNYETQSTTGGSQKTVDLPPGGTIRVNFGFREPPA
jgi:hypothetical protein